MANREINMINMVTFVSQVSYFEITSYHLGKLRRKKFIGSSKDYMFHLSLLTFSWTRGVSNPFNGNVNFVGVAHADCDLGKALLVFNVCPSP